MASTFFTLALAALTAAAAVRAESHTISFDNQCGKGTPQIVIGGQIVSNGEPWTTGSQAGIAYLQTGNCGLNGENCSLLEFNLNNPAPGCEGCGSSTDISLIDPHALNVPVAFEYVDGCNGQGNSCSTPDCAGAFHNPDDWQTQVACQTDNVGLLITFCPGGSGGAPASAPAASQSPASSKPALPASTQSAAAPSPPASAPAVPSSVPAPAPPSSAPAPAPPSSAPAPAPSSSSPAPASPSSSPAPAPPSFSSAPAPPSSSPAPPSSSPAPPAPAPPSSAPVAAPSSEVPSPASVTPSSSFASPPPASSGAVLAPKPSSGAGSSKTCKPKSKKRSKRRTPRDLTAPAAAHRAHRRSGHTY